MIRELKDVEQSTEGGRAVYYLRFSNLPIAKTEMLAHGLANVDIDHYGEVVGIELLEVGPETADALLQVVKEHALSLRWLFESAARGGVRARESGLV